MTRGVATMASATARPAAAGPAVAVLVLGDVGRSPRMQYHALSLASLGRRVLRPARLLPRKSARGLDGARQQVQERPPVIQWNYW